MNGKSAYAIVPRVAPAGAVQDSSGAEERDAVVEVVASFMRGELDHRSLFARLEPTAVAPGDPQDTDRVLMGFVESRCHRSLLKELIEGEMKKLS